MQICNGSVDYLSRLRDLVKNNEQVLQGAAQGSGDLVTLSNQTVDGMDLSRLQRFLSADKAMEYNVDNSAKAYQVGQEQVADAKACGKFSRLAAVVGLGAAAAALTGGVGVGVMLAVSAGSFAVSGITALNSWLQGVRGQENLHEADREISQMEGTVADRKAHRIPLQAALRDREALQAGLVEANPGVPVAMILADLGEYL